MAVEEALATPEVILKVRRTECAMSGHTYSVLEVINSDGPSAVICTNCGRSWGVAAAEESVP
jgi:hypothetical protein